MISASSQLQIVDESTQRPVEKEPENRYSTISNLLVLVLLVATTICVYGVYLQDVSKLEAVAELSSTQSVSSPSSSSSSLSSNRRHLLGIVDKHIGFQHPELSHPNLRYELDNLVDKGHKIRNILDVEL